MLSQSIADTILSMITKEFWSLAKGLSRKSKPVRTAQATHNEFMNQLMPILYQAIAKGVILSAMSHKAVSDTVNDHRMIMDFWEQRNAEGARNVMRIHIMHAIRELGIE